MATRILILGSEGFIGSHLVNYFTSKGYEVSGCDRREFPGNHYTYFQVETGAFLWGELFSQNSFDYCINAAGNGNVSYSISEPVDDFEANTFVTIKVLDALRRYNLNCRYLHLSSAAVYGNPSSLPVKESDPCKPISPYGWHKLMAEYICKEYNSLYQMNVAIVRPFSIYGPGLKKQIFWDTFQKYKENPLRIELWGTGNETRDFIYIDDVIEAFEIILEKAPLQGEVYNIGSGNEQSIESVVKLLFSNFDIQPEVYFNNLTREGDPLNWCADVTNLKMLGFENSTNMELGLKKMSEWLKQ